MPAPVLRWRCWLHAQRVAAQDREWIQLEDARALYAVTLRHRGQLVTSAPLCLAAPCARRYIEQSVFRELMVWHAAPVWVARRRIEALEELFKHGGVFETAAFREALCEVVLHGAPRNVSCWTFTDTTGKGERFRARVDERLN